MPVAHGEGKYYCTEETLEELKKEERIIFRYCDEEGNHEVASSPNGSLENIAAICNRERNVVGMMPHPERCCEEILGSTAGEYIFTSVLSYKGRCC